MKNQSILSFILALFLLTGCTSVIPENATMQPAETLFPTDEPTPTAQTSQPTAPSDTPASPVTLRVWVPPELDPASETPAGDIMQARLDKFVQRRPGVNVEVRVKAVVGPGGLLDSLITTSAAAPLVLPDLIALPRDTLETAALKGLLYPLEGLTETLESDDWYDYARHMAYLQDSVYGLPFAGDALTLIYRPSKVDTPPVDWAMALEGGAPLAFPAADPQSLFTLTQYQANEGVVRDDQGRPFLDAAVLTEVFTFYSEAGQVGVMPEWLTQYPEDTDAWEAFLDHRADIVATWASRYLSELSEDSAIAPMLTPDGQSFTLSTGWVWALATTQDERQELSIELAEFLTDTSYLAEWTAAAGYLPTKQSALSGWTDLALRPVVDRIARTAQLFPPFDILSSIGIPLQQGTVQILKGQDDPLTAAQSAAASLSEIK